MNLLIVGKDFPPGRGGISTYTKELAGALKNFCHVIVLAPGASGSAELDSASSFRIIRTPEFPMLRTLLLFFYMPLIVCRYRIDAVLHTVWPTALVSHLWYIFLRVPYFVSIHGSEILDDSQSWRRRLKGHLKVWRLAALKKASGIFPVSQYGVKLAKEMGLESSRIQVISNGVNPECFTPPGEKRTRRMGRKILLTVARLDLHKGHDRVLEALSILKDQDVTPLYRIVGEGDEEMRLRSITRQLGLTDQVKFEGYVKDSDLPDVYASADVFIMPSREIPGRLDLVEGFGISYLEASASGLPVVAGRSGGVPDAVLDGKTGILVDPEDSRDIARALKNLLCDSELSLKLGAQGREWTESQMNWVNIAEKFNHTVQCLTRSQG